MSICCKFCGKKLSTKGNLKRHYKTCKDIDFISAFIHMEDIVDKHQKEINELKKENKELKKMLKDQHIAGISNSTINNSTVSVKQDIHLHLNNYYNPHLEEKMIPSERLKNLLKINDANKIIAHIVDIVYRNPEYPQNHSIYLPNIKSDRIMVFEDGNWRSKPSSYDISNDLSNTAFDLYTLHSIESDDKLVVKNEKPFNKEIKCVLHKKLDQ